MSDHKLDIAFWNYDRTQALVDGDVRIDGVEATYHSARIVPEIFGRMIAGQYDVAEVGLTYFLRTMDFDDPPFLALPAFVNRAFRHSAIYINKNAGITRPEDLRGKTIGELALYGHDAGVMPKGMLSDEYGVTPDQSRWIIGGIDFAMDPIDFVPQPHPANVDVTWADKDTDLGKLLVSGEIDALISADVPEAVLQGRPEVGRLFEDYQTVERDYFESTGIFPIMHAVIVKKALAIEHPEIVRAVYKGFCDAKAVQEENFVKGMTFNNMGTMVPWLTKLIGENRAVLGEDWWPYGIEANRKTLEACLRYHAEQGLTGRRYAIEDIFVPYLLEA
jgi:4,5-dihydroxyphthalate decarboxylase